MRDLTGTCEFEGAARAIRRAGEGLFMVSPGDIDPPSGVLAVFQEVLGTDYDWYPVAGNHEAETAADMAWLRAFNPGGTALPRIVSTGGPPGSVETCYSFDEANAHFVVLNEYFDGIVDDNPVGDVGADLLAWLAADLSANAQPVVFVIGHEPAYPQPDAGPPHRLRHVGDSLDQFPSNRDAFWQTLADHDVAAYICGHTHDFSAIKVDGVWQFDVGHARGLADRGAPSTFLRFLVDPSGTVEWEAWRQDLLTGIYFRRDRGTL
jgi:hypothetical protein